VKFAYTLRQFTGCNWGDQVRNEMGRACGTYGREDRLGTLRVLVGKLLCIGSLGRSKRRWDNNIKMFLQAVERGRGVD
jgi:hypothetical protein